MVPLEFCGRSSAASKNAKAGKISLYHLHGYITPYKDVDPGDEAPDRLILTELEYTQRNDNPNHWAAATLQWALPSSPFYSLAVP